MLKKDAFGDSSLYSDAYSTYLDERVAYNLQKFDTLINEYIRDG